MSVDPAVIAALEAALAAVPDNDALRLHLAGLLLSDGKASAALAHAGEVLARTPDQVDALLLAADAALATGDQARAAGYRRLAAALGTPQPPAGPVGFGDPLPTAELPMVPDTADDLLQRWSSEPAAPEPGIGEVSRPTLRLADVGGMQEVKRRLELSFLAPLRNPGLREQFGKSLRGGLLLWGPPGCGKTHIARGLAGELGAAFYEIGLHDILEMWIGRSEHNLHATFEVARAHQPCVLFFDEIDALGHKRSQLRDGAAMRGVVNQFLTELDGASTDNSGVFVLAASNHPWDVDPALLRPGRFDRTVFVEPPDLAARLAILQIHLKDKPVGRLDLAAIAKRSEGRSGADLALVCDHATERAMEASMLRGALVPITQEDLLDGLRTTRGSIAEWLDTARNYATFANTNGAYDELAAYLKRRR